MKTVYYIFLFFILLVSCIDDPNEPSINQSASPRMLVLCEGLLGMENASITKIDDKNDVENNYYQNSNKKLLGDTANDILMKGDTAIVALTGSGVVEYFNVTTGKSITRISRDDFYPRSIAKYKDNIYISDLYANKIYKLDQSFNLSVFADEYLQNPEQIIIIDDFLYVANSGLGIFNIYEEYSGSISIFDLKTGILIDNINTGTNPQELLHDYNKNRIIVSYYNTYEKDSTGGIIIYSDLLLQNIDYHFKINNTSIEIYDNELYYIAQTPPGSDQKFISSVQKINLASYENSILIENNNEKEFWYSLAIEEPNIIWIGNAKNFQVNGEIIYYDLVLKNIFKKEIGLNPSEIIRINDK